METIGQRIAFVESQITEAAAHAGRRREEIRLILVSKFVPVERMREAYEAGARDFGENRAQELAEKARVLPKDIRWHMIGHLQRNKAKLVAECATMLQSLDDLMLAKTLDGHLGGMGRNMETLIQVNTSGETSKFGLAPEKAEGFVRDLVQFPRLLVKGLMTIGPLTDDRARVREAFRKLRQLCERLTKTFPENSWAHLSMGMSQDFRIAIEEGATMIRVGTAIFGERKK